MIRIPLQNGDHSESILPDIHKIHDDAGILLANGDLPIIAYADIGLDQEIKFPLNHYILCVREEWERVFIFAWISWLRVNLFNHWNQLVYFYRFKNSLM